MKITNDTFMCNFVNENCFISIFVTELYSLKCEWWEIIIGLDNGSVPKIQQAFIETTHQLFERRIYGETR